MITEKLYQLCTASQNKIYLDCWPKPDFIWLRPELNQGPFLYVFVFVSDYIFPTKVEGFSFYWEMN